MFVILKEINGRGKKVNDCQNRRTMNMEKTDEFIIKKVKQVMKDSVTFKERFKEDILEKQRSSVRRIRETKKELESY